MSFKNVFIGSSSAVITAVILAASSSAYAHTAHATRSNETCNWGSFYIGAGLDRNGSFTTTNFTTNVFNLDGSLGFTETTYANASGGSTVFGTLLVGYETHYWNRFNLGLEAFFSATPKSPSETGISLFNSTTQLPTPNTTDELVQGWENFEINSYFGIALLPGYQVQNDVTVNARLGYGAGRLTWQEFNSDVFYASGESTTGISGLEDTYNSNTYEYLRAYTLGLGFKVRTSENLSVVLGYNWTGFKSTNLSFALTDPENGTETYSWKKSPQMEVATAQFLYYFTPTEHYCEGPAVRSGSEFYIGGFGVRDNTFISSIENATNPQVIPYDPTTNFNQFYTPGTSVTRGWGFEVLAGYGYTLPCGAYIGGEGFYNYARSVDASNVVSIIPGNVSAGSAGATEYSQAQDKLTGGYGVAFISGYKSNNNTLLYARLGFVERDIKSFAGLQTNIDDPRSVAVSNFDVSKNLYGYQLGAGVDVRVCDCWFVRAEYTLNYFGNWEQDRIQSPFTSASGNGFQDSFDINYSVLTGQFKLGLEYKFEV